MSLLKIDADACLEEALTSAYAYRRIMEEYFRKDHQKKEAVKKTLKEYVDKCPIEYQEAINYTKVEKSLKTGGMSLPKQIIRQPGPDLL